MKNPRGSILDRDGEELAVSIITGSLYVDPQEMRDGPDGSRVKPPPDIQRKAAKLLAPVLKMTEEELFNDFSTPGRFLWIKRVLEPKEYDEAKRIIKENKLPGLHFLSASKRYYTKNRAAAQIIGFVASENVPAPPSPNCTLHSGSNVGLIKKIINRLSKSGINIFISKNCHTFSKLRN